MEPQPESKRQEIAQELGQLMMAMMERLEADFDLDNVELDAAAVLVCIENEPGNVQYAWFTTCSSYHEHLGLLQTCLDAYRYRSEKSSDTD